MGIKCPDAGTNRCLNGAKEGRNTEKLEVSGFHGFPNEIGHRDHPNSHASR
jgi:hypothetical protein